jgi:nicotinate (nicotinamide) nucleotide adenylyltransferase
MAQDTLIYFGTFNPVHRGHMHWLRTAYDLEPFETAYILPVAKNPFKPWAIDVHHRKEMLRRALASERLPFITHVEDIPYIYPDQMADFVRRPLHGKRATCLIGSDLLVEFAADPKLHQLFTMFDFLNLVRPITSVAACNAAIASLPDSIRQQLQCRTHVVDFPNIASSSMRDVVRESYDAGYISEPVFRYAEEHGLYSMGKVR